MKVKFDNLIDTKGKPIELEVKSMEVIKYFGKLGMEAAKRSKKLFN